MSFHYRDWVEKSFLKNLWGDPDHKILIDSGAFNAFTQKVVIDRGEYLDYARGLSERLSNEMYFFNLDVIGDQGLSWKNQEWFESQGLVPIPVVTFGAAKADVERCLQNYDYWALGGLVPHTNKKTKLTGWLNQVFSQVLQHWKKTGVMPRVHLLGVGQEWVLRKYPAFSCDSSSYSNGPRYGNTRGLVPFVPTKGKHGETADYVMKFLIKDAIQKEEQKGREATELWKARGVHFDETPAKTGRFL
jgi:hypothetical protein